MNKITSLEYSSLLWFVIRASYIGLSLSNVINICGRDAPFVTLISIILGLIPLFIFMYLRNYDKDKNIGKLVLTLFNHGKVFNVLLIIGAFTFVLMAFIDLTSFVNSQFLFKTNYYYIAIALIIPVVYALFKGIDAISKMSLIMFYAVVFIIICIVLGVFNSIDLNNLKPFFQTDTSNFIHSIGIMIAYHVLPIFLLLIIPRNQIKNYSFKQSLIFYFLAFGSLLNATFLTIAIFGTNLSHLYEYPEFHVLKKAEMGDFIDRVENIFSLEWIVALIILIIVGLHFILEMIKTTFKTKEKTNKVLIFLVCFTIVFLGNELFITNSSASSFYESYMVIIMFSFFFIIPIIIMIKAILKKHFFSKYNG